MSSTLPVPDCVTSRKPIRGFEEQRRVDGVKPSAGGNGKNRAKKQASKEAARVSCCCASSVMPRRANSQGLICRQVAASWGHPASLSRLQVSFGWLRLLRTQMMEAAMKTARLPRGRIRVSQPKAAKAAKVSVRARRRLLPRSLASVGERSKQGSASCRTQRIISLE